MADVNFVGLGFNARCFRFLASGTVFDGSMSASCIVDLISLDQNEERIRHTSSFAISFISTSSLSESNESSSSPPSETGIANVSSSGSEST
jgi:hypothetical protein